MRELVPIMEGADILANPLTRRPSRLLSKDGDVQAIVFEALARGVHCEVGQGSRLRFEVVKKERNTGRRRLTLGAYLHTYNENAYNEKVPTAKPYPIVRETSPFFGIAPFT